MSTPADVTTERLEESGVELENPGVRNYVRAYLGTLHVRRVSGMFTANGHHALTRVMEVASATWRAEGCVVESPWITATWFLGALQELLQLQDKAPDWDAELLLRSVKHLAPVLGQAAAVDILEDPLRLRRAVAFQSLLQKQKGSLLDLSLDAAGDALAKTTQLGDGALVLARADVAFALAVPGLKLVAPRAPREQMTLFKREVS